MTPVLRAIEVWLVDLETSAAALDELEAALPRLDPHGLPTAPEGQDEARHQLRRSAHIALRILIERQLGSQWRGVPLARTLTGKPHLPGLEQGSFSLSHTDRFALIAIARRHHVGIDLECHRAVSMTPERRARIIEAAHALAPSDPLPLPEACTILQAWVRLEAVAKASGRGIGNLLTEAGAIGRKGKPAAVFPGIGGGFRVRDLVLGEGLFGAIAADGFDEPPEVRAFPLDAGAIRSLLG